jgi:hypothetical protein
MNRHGVLWKVCADNTRKIFKNVAISANCRTEVNKEGFLILFSLICARHLNLPFCYCQYQPMNSTPNGYRS